jgi:hypothetical protein
MTFNYTSKCELADRLRQPTVTCVVTTDAETLPEILSDFERFLKGSGFVFNGSVTIGEDET